MVRVSFPLLVVLAGLTRPAAAQVQHPVAEKPKPAVVVVPPAARPSRLQLNALPSDFHGQPSTVAPATASPVMRVWLRVVDADGQPQAHAQVRAEGASQSLWADDHGTLSLLVDISHGPLHLTASAFGYDDAPLTIARPEDNNLVFQLFRSAPTKAR